MPDKSGTSIFPFAPIAEIPDNIKALTGIAQTSASTAAAALNLLNLNFFFGFLPFVLFKSFSFAFSAVAATAVTGAAMFDFALLSDAPTIFATISAFFNASSISSAEAYLLMEYLFVAFIIIFSTAVGKPFTS